MKRGVLVVTEGGDAWPSGHIRALIYRDLFAAEGVAVRYTSRLAPPLTKLIVHPGRLSSRLMGLGLGRLLGGINGLLARGREAAIVRAADRYDVIYLQKVLSPSFIHRLRKTSRARIVYDLNDGVWLPWMNRFTGGSVEEILSCVDAVTCDNSHGTAFARRYNSNAFLVPDPPQVELFDQYRQQAREGVGGDGVVIGWIGSPATAFNLYSIWEPLERVFEKCPRLRLLLVGVGHDWRLWPRFEKVRFRTVPFYSQAQMVQEVSQMDVGLFPLFDVEDSRARGVLKATVYMSAEACVVASGIGDCRRLIEDGKNGVLASTPREWVEKLTLVAEDEGRRREVARAGLETVRREFSLERCFDKLKQALLGSR